MSSSSKDYECSLCHLAYGITRVPLLTQCCHSTGCSSCLPVSRERGGAGGLSLLTIPSPGDEVSSPSGSEGGNGDACPFCSKTGLQTVENKIIQRMLEGNSGTTKGNEEEKETTNPLLMC